MNIVFLFPNGSWNKKTVSKYLESINLTYKLRVGFGHLVAVSEESLNRSQLTAPQRCYVVGYDNEKRLAQKTGYEISEDGFLPVPISELIDSVPDLHWDLQNVGFPLRGGVKLEDLYDAIRSCEVAPNREADILSASECRDIVADDRIPGTIRKLALDFFTLRATAILTATCLTGSNDPLRQYATVFLVSFVTRAQFEKLMLLVAYVDPALDYEVLDKSKRMKATFRKQASQSTLDLTKRFWNVVESLELLDDNYRTPETHKLGRILAIVHKGQYTSALNEVLSFQNTVNNFFWDLCNYLRKEYGLQNIR